MPMFEPGQLQAVAARVEVAVPFGVIAETKQQARERVMRFLEALSTMLDQSIAPGTFEVRRPKVTKVVVEEVLQVHTSEPEDPVRITREPAKRKARKPSGRRSR
jgi:hypothetical protein